MICILLVLCASFSSFAQSDKIDSLINEIANKNVIDDGDYVGAKITLRGNAVDALLKIGKPASNKLVNVLTDSTKGIIAHCILTWIWGKGERPKTYCSDRDHICMYLYNNLCFFRNSKGIYTNLDYLIDNQFEWSLFINHKHR